LPTYYLLITDNLHLKKHVGKTNWRGVKGFSKLTRALVVFPFKTGIAAAIEASLTLRRCRNISTRPSHGIVDAIARA
jgi:hypothetical protein